jgi:HTH-type transcriptional regulator/antitoxin HigA|tara:strand:+ start:2738 stop:3112 length:375 start_codon:yes stop_codon:yes gene_type:complete
MDISAIHTEEDYNAAMARIEVLMDAESNTPEGDELEILGTLVHTYEEINYPIEAPDPIEFIKNVMEFRGYNQKDFADLLNSRSRASELLKKSRPLSLKHIRIISGTWDIPVEPLVQEYKLKLQA